MSEEQLKAFLSKVQSDESLQNKLKAEGADVVSIAKEAGFNITAAELMRYQAQAVGDLSDEELENAAGGISVPILCVMCGVLVATAIASDAASCFEKGETEIDTLLG